MDEMELLERIAEASAELEGLRIEVADREQELGALVARLDG